MNDPDFWREQRDQTFASHVAPLNRSIDALATNSVGGRAPYIAPWYVGTEAPILSVLRDPGPGADGGDGSGYLCTQNDDETARRLLKVVSDAGIDPRMVIPWNAYPWYINRRPTSAELPEGTEPLHRIVSLLPRLRFVVLHGAEAHRAWRLYLGAHLTTVAEREIRWIETYHPSRQALRTPDPRERAAREADLANAYALAASSLRSGKVAP